MRAEVRTLFDPKVKPLEGFASSPHPMSMEDRVWPLLGNVRLGDGTIRCRGGQSASLATIQAATATFSGVATLNVNGTPTMFVAVKSGSDIIIKKSTDGTTWTEITAASGQYGATRLTDTSQPVNFSTFRTPRSGWGDAVLIQNGTDTPRVYTTNTVKHEAISAPFATRDTPVRFDMSGFYAIRNSGNTTYTGGAGGITMADQTATGGNAATDNTIRVSITAAVANNDSVICTFASPATFGDATSQFIVGVDTAYPEFWNRVMLEVGVGGSFTTIWDPTSTSSPPPTPIPLDSTNKTIWVFDNAVIAGLNNTFDQIRLTYKAVSSAAPAATKTADIFLFAKGGEVPGTSLVGTTYYSGGSLAESKGVIYNRYEPVCIKDIGGPVYAGLRLPNHPAIKFRIWTPYVNTSTTDRDKGVNTLSIYLQRPKDADLYLWTTYAIASYSAPNWSFVNSAATGVPYYAEIESSSPPDSTIRIPSEYHLPIPIGRCALWAGERLFVGLGSSGSVYISERRDGTRFRLLPNVVNGVLDPDSAFQLNCGNDSINQLCQVTPAALGTSTVYIFGESSVYVVSGSESWQLSQVGNLGCPGTISPESVSVWQNVIFYLDREMRVRAIAGGSVDDLTTDIIDDELALIPATRRVKVFGRCIGDLYYLAHSATGGTTNTRILVLDIRKGRWISRDTPAVPAEGILNWFDASANVKAARLLTFGVASNAVNVYEYDLLTQSQDLGTTNITVTLTTPEYHEKDGKALFVGRIGITADDVASSTATITRTYKKSGSTGVSSLNMDVSTNQLVRYDGEQTTPAGSGVTCQINFSIPMTAGKRIYKIIAEFEPRDHAYDRSS